MSKERLLLPHYLVTGPKAMLFSPSSQHLNMIGI